jgi:hypothetical protein
MILVGAETVTLPSGIWTGEDHHREIELCPVRGKDVEELSQMLRPKPLAARATHLLSRCVCRLGSMEGVTAEMMRSLTVGDREAILLALRKLTLGNRIDCVLKCPAAVCGEQMDLELSVDALLLDPYGDVRSEYEVRLERGDKGYLVRFRLPTGADQERAAVLLEKGGQERATDFLLHQCIREVALDDRAADAAPLEEWPVFISRTMPGIMAEHDPQAEVMLDVTCPACGQRFQTLFDTASYFFSELGCNSEQLYREVHRLALHYKWSEADILSMSVPKRRLYLNLLEESFASGGDHEQFPG